MRLRVVQIHGVSEYMMLPGEDGGPGSQGQAAEWWCPQGFQGSSLVVIYLLGNSL